MVSKETLAYKLVSISSHALSDPYQFGVDCCQLIVTANAKPTLVKKNLEQQLKAIYSLNLQHCKGGGRHELRRKHRDACNSGADTFFYWTVGHQARGPGGRHLQALRDPRAGHCNNCQVGPLGTLPLVTRH